jgi:hypothetical protein
MMTDKVWQTDKALKQCACMIGYNPTKGAISPLMPRGWLVREYHSTTAMECHLKEKAAPAHWKPGWEHTCYGDAGPFRTEEEAREYALHGLF